MMVAFYPFGKTSWLAWSSPKAYQAYLSYVMKKNKGLTKKEIIILLEKRISHDYKLISSEARDKFFASYLQTKKGTKKKRIRRIVGRRRQPRRQLNMPR